MSEEDKLERLREKKRKQLREQAEQSQQPEQQEQTAERDAILRQLLTEDARQRLNNIEMRGDEERAESIRNTLVQLSQSGQIGDTVGDEQMRKLLKETATDSTDYNIRGMRSRRRDRTE